MWDSHVDDYAKVIYYMILGRYLLTWLVLNLKISDYVVEADDGPFKGPMSSMVDMGTYGFKYLNTGEIVPEESFTNNNAEDIHKSEQVCNSAKRLGIILDDKDEKAYLNNVTKNQCQHLTETQHNELLKLLQKSEELFNLTLLKL